MFEPVLHVLSICALVLGSLAIQWIVLRARHRGVLAQQRARHLQYQQAASRQIEQGCLHIQQLQLDLSEARMQLDRLAQQEHRHARVHEAMLRAFDESEPGQSHSRRTPPGNGFAETLPMPHN